MNSQKPNKDRSQVAKKPKKAIKSKHSEFIRAANEDDDGYDPYSDRRPVHKMFEKDPWR